MSAVARERSIPAGLYYRTRSKELGGWDCARSYVGNLPWVCMALCLAALGSLGTGDSILAQSPRLLPQSNPIPFAEGLNVSGNTTFREINDLLERVKGGSDHRGT
ncbi:MAG: hypothetical protein KGQ60_17665, partial [Planctomycetes bacterium]|nr:hypothetical protein [Planctomycetota bacterium]